MRRAAICLAMLIVAGAASVAAQGAKTQGVKVSATDRARAAKPEAKAARTSPVALAQDPAQYVGETTCLTCHDQKYDGTAHAVKANSRTPAATNGCESCHGPGKAHVDGGGDPTKIVNLAKLAPQRASETCATCHDRSNHALWSGSQHDTRNVGCVTCHSVHTPKGPKQIKAASELSLCASCHRDKIAKLDRSGHMPVREGKMQCTTCHNPHGATNVRLLRRGDSIAEACTSCHADKRGPYLWEHAPGRDGCTTCHDPHGSSNERMLVSKPPILCQRCHVATRHPSTIYDAGLIGAGATPSIRIYARSCVTCHSAIHGSNHPSGQRFIR